MRKICTILLCFLFLFSTSTIEAANMSNQINTPFPEESGVIVREKNIRSERWKGFRGGTQLTENEDGTLNMVILFAPIIYVVTLDQNLNPVTVKEHTINVNGAPREVYLGKYNNYILSTNDNSEENDDKIVISLTKFTKNFEQLGSFNLTGGESHTVSPLAWENPSISENEDGSKIVVHTARTRYQTNDSLHHQSNLTFVVDTNTMTSQSDVSDFPKTHVAHSFGQAARWDKDNLILLDVGDADPRALYLQQVNDTKNTINKSEIFHIYGNDGDNTIGVSIAGMEIGEDYYISAGTSTDQSKSQHEQRTQNIYVSYTDKNTLKSKLIWLTNYKSDNLIEPTNPTMIKIDNNQFVIFWNENGSGISYAVVDGQGHITKPYTNVGFNNHLRRTKNRFLYYDGKIIWNDWNVKNDIEFFYFKV